MIEMVCEENGVILYEVLNMTGYNSIVEYHDNTGALMRYFNASIVEKRLNWESEGWNKRFKAVIDTIRQVFRK